MSNDYFKAQGWFKTYALNSQDSRGVFQELVKEDEEAFRLASAETDRIKAMMNEKYGPGTVKYGSELPPIQNPFKDFEERNPAAEGGRIGFNKGLDVLPFKKLKNGKYSLRLYLGTENGKRIEKTFTGTKKQLKKIYKDRNIRTGASVFENTIEYADSKGIPYEVKQGENKGKFAIRGPKEKNFSFYDTEELAQEHIDNYRAETDAVGGDRTAELENKKYKKGYKTKKQFLNFLAKNNIAGKNAASFAMNFNIKTKVNPYNNNAYIYDTSQFTPKKIEEIQKAQISSGTATEYAKKKFPVKTISESQKPRLDAIEVGGGVKKNDPYAGKRGSGIELGHTGNIFGTELITGDRLAYTPTEVNQLMGKKGNIDDKIRSVSAKIEKIKNSDKPVNVKKDLLEQADNILIRLASQSQGFKKVTLSSGGTFGGDRLTIDPFNTYPGKTEKEIQKIQKEYLGKKIITEEMAAKNPKLKVTPPEEIQKIQDAFFFEKNRKEVMKASKKIGKKEIKKINENINLDFDKQAEAYITDRTGKVKPPSSFIGVSSGFNTDLIAEDLKKIMDTEGFKTFKANIADPALEAAGKAVKVGSKVAALPTKVFGGLDLVLGYLDYSNNRQKGFSKADSTKHMVDAVLFGATSFGKKADIAGVREIANKNGMSNEVFDNLMALNTNQKKMMNLINKSKAEFNESMDIIESGAADPTAEKMLIQKLKVDTKKSLTNTMKNIVDDSRSLNTNLQVQESGAPIGINVDTQKAYSDLGSSSREFVQNRIDASDLENIANQKDTTKGGIGDAAMSGLKAMYTQPKFIYDLINPLSPLPKAKDFFPKDLNYKAQMEQLKKEDPTMYYKMLMSEGVDPRINLNLPVQLEFEQKYGDKFGTQLTDGLTQNKAEGGITQLRSKYEYKK